MKYESQIELGKVYVDPQTGLRGTAVALTFHQFGCERVAIEVLTNGEIKTYEFDAPRVRLFTEPERPITTERTGGPGRTADGFRPGRRSER